MREELKSTLKYLKNKNNTRRIKAITITEAQKVVEEIERLNNKNKELYDDLKTLWIVLWNMDTEMTGYQNEVFDKYYDEFHKGSDKE